MYDCAVRLEGNSPTPAADSPLKTKVITYTARDTTIAARRPGSCFPFAIFSFRKIPNSFLSVVTHPHMWFV